MRAPESRYNAGSRQIEWKLEVFFDGISNNPVIITRDNFLISAAVLEEAMTSSNTPWGKISANELTASIQNAVDQFNPANSAGPYYSKIKPGLQIDAYIRPTNNPAYEWDPIGKFFVSDWITKSGGLTADITCYDQLSMVLNAPKIKMPVYRGITEQEFISNFFSTAGVPVIIDSTINQTLIFGYHSKENKDFLNNISSGMNLFIFCDHLGRVCVKNMRTELSVAHTITDSDQIIDISAQQNAALDYDGIQLYQKVPQLSNTVEILSARNVTIPSGGLSVQSQVFAKSPVADVLAAKVTAHANSFVNWHESNSIDFNYTVTNVASAEHEANIIFYGRVIETVDTVLTDVGSNLLKLNNIYVQTAEQFESMERFLHAWVSGLTPIIDITVRGNPQFEIGQKIHVESTRYNIIFDGVLIRQKLRYDGGLSGTITLMNSRILEV